MNSITDHTQQYLLHLADNALILAQRNSAWCGHGPVLEQDIAITNITLDHIGLARNWYQHLASSINEKNGDAQISEDDLAYLRLEREYRNCLLTELPNGDWGKTILRLYFFSEFQGLLYQELVNSQDTSVAAIAAKALKEITYHIRWSREWVIRLGDGTEESHTRMQEALDLLWPYTGEFFLPASFEMSSSANSLAIAVAALQQHWLKLVQQVLEEAALALPQNVYMHRGGKEGIHTEHMGFILSDLQYLQRAFPGCEW